MTMQSSPFCEGTVVIKLVRDRAGKKAQMFHVQDTSPTVLLNIHARFQAGTEIAEHLCVHVTCMECMQ
jgi:hypothetical protein